MFEPVSKLLPKIFNQYGLTPALSGTLIINKCTEFLADHLSRDVFKEIRPLYLKKDVLYLEVTSSLVAQEVNFVSMDLLNELNNFDEKIKVKSIRFKLK